MISRRRSRTRPAWATALTAVALALAACGSDSGSDSGSLESESAPPASDEPAVAETPPEPGGSVPATEPAATEPGSTEQAATDPGSTESATPGGSPADGLGGGPVTVVALGDSLTAGQGDEDGQGFAGDLTGMIDALPGRSGSTLVNLGASAWDSTAMVEGQLDAAVAETTAAVAAGAPVLATILIGSNDIWYLYDSDGDQDAVAELYRTNVDRAVGELTKAGAVVVVGLPHDQSKLPGVQDIDNLHLYLPNVTEEEVELMSPMADRLAEIAAEVATEHGARTVDTESRLWSDAEMLDPDGIHPNSAGYQTLAEIWFAEVETLL